MKKVERKVRQTARPSIRSVSVYDDPNHPRFAGQYASQSPAFSGRITAATFNIREGRAVAEAAVAMLTLDGLKEADIFFLQEMDESGVDHIARQLEANFIYYPAYRARNGRHVGNAILTRLPMSIERKIVLPGRHPITGQIRIAVRAAVHVGDKSVTVYSVHTETYSTFSKHRREQVAGLIKDIGPGSEPMIVGGDFNTVSKRSVQRMTEQFAAAGLTRASAGVGPTIAKFGLRPAAADHIFARGFSIIDAGKVEVLHASDHLPVWTQLTWAGADIY